MFPGYIFVQMHAVDDFHTVKYTRGVKTIVHFGGKIVPLPDNFIDFIQSKLDGGVATVQKRRYETGEKILIKDGPFKGLTGIFEREMDGRERVAILLEGISYAASMEIDRDLISSMK
jgi:transcriptional antiterminator RfaH